MLRYLHILTLSLSPSLPLTPPSLSFSLSLYIYIYLFGHTSSSLWREGSLIFVTSRKIFRCSLCDHVPWPGMELVPPSLGAWSLSHWPREVPWHFIFWNLRTRDHDSTVEIIGVNSCSPFLYPHLVGLSLLLDFYDQHIRLASRKH